MNDYVPASLLCDFYKVSHRNQYPEGTEMIYSTFTPRVSRIPGIDKVVVFGLQAFVKKYLVDYFNENFFNRPLSEVTQEYKRVIKYTLGEEHPYAHHIAVLWHLGYLPIRIKAVKEGTLLPIHVPMMTIENTHPEFFWLTNYLETIISNEIWLPSTSATIAFQYRKILEKYAKETVGNSDAVPFQAHDFSMRGMASFDASQASGAAHLLSFQGTDVIPAILYLEHFYGANIEKELVGSSIPATEHSVMEASAEGKEELGTFKRLINEVYPKGFVSIVSDTYDFWGIIEKVIPQLKEDILNRDGKVVIRPDTGDPVKMIVGDPEGKTELERKGLVEALWDIFGGTTTEKGYRLLESHIGTIYGDSITLDRAEAICQGLKDKGFASINTVLGVGSFSYQYNTRDTFGFAMKATHAVISGKEKQIFKDPKTGNGMKKSQKGIVVVYKSMSGEIVYSDQHSLDDREQAKDYDLLEDVFVDGELKRDQSLSEIRKDLLSNL